MKAIIYHSGNDIRLEDIPIPEPGPGELILKVAGCGLCGSDLAKIVQNAPQPVILGHELAGRVVAVGDGSPFAVGIRLTVAHHVPCGECHLCQRGNYSMCAAFKASNIAPCGFAECILVPAKHAQETAFALPDSMSYETASFTEPLGCAARAVRRAGIAGGDTAVIFGLGTVGILLAKSVVAHKGIAIGVDILPERTAWAREQGILALSGDSALLKQNLDESTNGLGADVAFITAGGPLAVTEAIQLVRPGGQIHLFAASPGQTFPLDLAALYSRELTVTATYSSSPADLGTAFNWLSTGRVSVEGLISHRLPLERFAEGVELFKRHVARKVYFEIDPNV